MTDGIIYYKVLNVVKLNKQRFNQVRDIFLIQFCEDDLTHPDSTPIGMFFESGVRHYVWDDAIWNECEVGDYITEIAMRSIYSDCDNYWSNVLNLYFNYKRSRPPIPETTRRASGLDYTRAIYKTGD